MCAPRALGQADDVVEAISRMRKWDCFCLQEVAREGEEVHRRQRGGDLLNVAPCSEGAWSVGLVIHRDWLQFVVSFSYVRRCCWAVLRMNTCEGERKMIFGSAHLPHTSLPDEAYEEAILDLDGALSHGRRVVQFWGVDANTELHSGLDAQPATYWPPYSSTALIGDAGARGVSGPDLDISRHAGAEHPHGLE